MNKFSLVDTSTVNIKQGKRTKKGKQGFASMSPEKVREIASIGGKSQGKHNNRGNFANDIEKAKRAGSKGGALSRRTA